MKNSDSKILMERWKHLGTPAKLLLAVLLMYQNKDDEVVFPQNEELSRVTGWAVRTVREAFAELRSAGAIEVRQAGVRREVTFTTGGGFPPEADSRREGGGFPPEGRRIPANGSYIEEKESMKESGKERPRGQKTEKGDAGSENSSSSGAGSDFSPPSSAHPSPDLLPEVRGLAGLGKSDREWAKLFNDLMGVVGRGAVTWDAPTVPLRLRMSFNKLNAVMVAAKWWPSEEQWKAVRWRYVQPREHAVKGCVGGHRKASGVGYFIEDFYMVCTECETEWRFVHGVEQTPLFEVQAQEARTAFLERPVEEWSVDQILQALAWKEITAVEADAEIARRNGGGV